MFKRLFSNEIDKILLQCKIDKSHDMISVKKITELAANYFGNVQSIEKKNVNINININNNINNSINININNNGQNISYINNPKKNELIKTILKKIRSSCEVMRIKGLIVAHSIIKKTYDEEFMEIIAQEMDKYIVQGLTPEQKQSGLKTEMGNQQKIMIKIENSQQQFIKRNIISFYCQYLKKFIMSIQTYRFAQKYMNGAKPKDQNIIQIINHGFLILNLINYILQSQYTFNKMGRYYIEHHEIINLFIMYLMDLIIYNNYVKEISKMSVKNIKNSGSQEMKHYFLFITESQKSSDRLYEFFYNRYYYSKIKKLVMMPTFLNIHNDQYKELVNHVKKNDRELLLLVKNNKYQMSQRGRSRSKTVCNEEIQKVDRMNKTQIIEKVQHEMLSMMEYVTDQQKEVSVTTSFSKKFTNSAKKSRSVSKPA